jgi:hypothetical protein
MIKPQVQKPEPASPASHKAFNPPTPWQDPLHCSLPIQRSGEISCAESEIPVWRMAPEMATASVFQGQFVRYSDMPAAMAQTFREQQVFAGKPFDGAAYVEDFQLFVDLRNRRG